MKLLLSFCQLIFVFWPIHLCVLQKLSSSVWDHRQAVQERYSNTGDQLVNQENATNLHRQVLRETVVCLKKGCPAPDQHATPNTQMTTQFDSQ